MKISLYLLAVGLLVVAGCGGGATEPSASSGATKRVVLLRYNPGSESTEQREQGFLDTIEKEFPGISILSSDQYAGTTPESSLDKAEQVLIKYGNQTDGIFAVCEPNCMGVLGALENASRDGKIKFVGFDPSPRLVQAMRAKKMDGIVLQDPVTMGYLAVKTMVASLQGKPVEKRIATGEYVATPENMDGRDSHGADIKTLLSPQQFTDEQQAKPEQTDYVIAVIPKGTTHEFWKSVHAGAENAARELGHVEIRWKGPLLENDREGQINVVQDFITQKVDGICLAPLDSQALIQSVKDAKREGIPTVIFDSGLDDKDVYVSYVATDNYHGGVLAARRLAEALGVASSAAEKKTPAPVAPSEDPLQ